MNASSFDFDRSEVLHLRRDSVEHAWMAAIGGGWVPLPWAETADAVSVVMWLEGGRAGQSRYVSIINSPRFLPPKDR